MPMSYDHAPGAMPIPAMPTPSPRARSTRWVRHLAATLLLALPVSAAAQSVRFTGTTTADEVLLVDTLRSLATLGPALFDCPTVEAVEASVLPGTFDLADETLPEGDAPTTYERWDATFCGHKTTVLVAFWSADDGGMMFRIGHPFPGDQAIHSTPPAAEPTPRAK